MEDVKREIDDHMYKLEHYIRTLNAEIKARTVLITVLEQTDAFYHNQKGEVKVVANVRTVQRVVIEALNKFHILLVPGLQKFWQSNKNNEKKVR